MSKRKYYSDYFLNNRNDSKKTWKGIKEIINTKNKGLHSPSTLQYNNEVITDTKTIANAFNEFFANVGRHLASAIPTVNELPQEYITAQTSNTFFSFSNYQCLNQSGDN